MNNTFFRLGVLAALVIAFFVGLSLTKEIGVVAGFGWLLTVGAPISAFYYLKSIFYEDNTKRLAPPESTKPINDSVEV